MIKIVTEGSVSDFASDLKDRVTSTIDYLKGKSTNNLVTEEPTDMEIRNGNKTLDKIIQELKKGRTSYTVGLDRKKNKFLLKFDSTKVPNSLVDKIKPSKSKNSWYKYVSSYNPSDKNVEMIFDVTGKLPERSQANLTRDMNQQRKSSQKSKSTTSASTRSNSAGESESLELRDSVMAPTPTPYKLRNHIVDKDGHHLSDDEWNEFSKEYLEEVVISDPVAVAQEDDLPALKVMIGETPYLFKMKDDSPYSIDQMMNKVSKMNSFSSGKALQFLKKNMVGTRITEGKSFKDLCICQTCGKPLSKCICGIDEECLSETIDSLGSTQSSDIGQHKVCSIDLVDEDDEEGDED